MALDIYLISLNRFFVGDYTSPLEAAFGDKAVRVGSDKAQMTADEATAYVSELQEDLSDEFQVDCTWEDRAEEDYCCEQFDYDAFLCLQAYAANLDFPIKSGLRRQPVDFDPEEHTENHPGIEKIWNGADTRFQHLVIHACNCGIWVPASFDSPVPLDEEGNLIAGSSQRLLEELSILNGELGVTKLWDELADGEAICDEDDPLGIVKYGYAMMFCYAKKSVEKNLPIVFDG